MKTEIIKKNPIEQMIKEELRKHGRNMQISASYYEAIEEEVKRLVKKLIKLSIENTTPEEKRLMKKHIENIIDQVKNQL